MYVYPLMRGGLLIINPMIVRDDVLQQILALGEPTVYLFVPLVICFLLKFNYQVLICLSDNFCPVHTKDVRAWRQKFPKSIFVWFVFSHRSSAYRIFFSPNTAYYRMVRDIPLVHLRDLTIEIQMHYDGMELLRYLY